jgi:DNA-directed RNA polymerase subunit RPC12/RpoP
MASLSVTVRIVNDLKRVCAWCGKDMGTKPSSETGTTHGMCPDCAKKAEEELDAMKTSAEKRNELAALGARKYGTADNDKLEIGDQVFINLKTAGADAKKGDDVQYKGRWVKLKEKDEYPIGNPGWWAEIRNADRKTHKGVATSEHDYVEDKTWKGTGYMFICKTCGKKISIPDDRTSDYSGMNAVDPSGALDLLDEYTKEVDPNMTLEGDLWTPQRISRWLSGRGIKQGDINAIIGIWKREVQDQGVG